LVMEARWTFTQLPSQPAAPTSTEYTLDHFT
jgi:hypothetical protein